MTVRDLVAAAGGVTGLALFGAACVTGCAAWRCGGMRPVARDSDARPPVIGAWFWSKEELEPRGYTAFLDEAAARSPYTLLTTACRQAEVVEPRVHAQLAEAVRYAASRGLAVAWEVDVRLAREHFRERYPEELQEELVLRPVTFAAGAPAEVVFEGRDTTDHMNGSLPAYTCLATRLVRAYAYARGSDGIEAGSVRDVSGQVAVLAAEPRVLKVRVPAQPEGEVCVIAAHTVLTPDVFAPHLLAYQRAIIRQYADIPLAGIMKDEWGFPPDHTGNPAQDRYWYSRAMADAYAAAAGGSDLIRDALLMALGERGRERERAAAVNRYRALCRDRNAEIEDDFYRAGKEHFGPDAWIVTHATWTPYPGAQEFRKNGLSWWHATRDVGQSDESTPYACRTSLAKRWGYPLWYNQYYAKEPEPYIGELWAGALSGGRLNVHPLYPRSDLPRSERNGRLMRSGLMAGMTRLRMLDEVSGAPLACPVAVVFGHACAMNWTHPAYNDVGLGIASALSAKGFPVDLIPSSLAACGALTLDTDGSVRLGEQRYRAVVLHQPEYGGDAERAFFRRAAQGGSALFRVGDWLCDSQARPYADGGLPLAPERVFKDGAACVEPVLRALAAANVQPVTPWTARAQRWGHAGGKLAAPPVEGFTVLTDGTYIRVAGARQAEGDPIQERFSWQGHDLEVDAVGLVAVRLAPDGSLAAFAAGGFKHLRVDGLDVTVPERVDIAFKRGEDGRVRGVWQGAQPSLPDGLRAFTRQWTRLPLPASEGVPQ